MSPYWRLPEARPTRPARSVVQRIALMETSSYRELDKAWRDELHHLHDDYFHHRQAWGQGWGAGWWWGRGGSKGGRGAVRACGGGVGGGVMQGRECRCRLWVPAQARQTVAAAPSAALTRLLDVCQGAGLLCGLLGDMYQPGGKPGCRAWQLLGSPEVPASPGAAGRCPSVPKWGSVRLLPARLCCAGCPVG